MKSAILKETDGWDIYSDGRRHTFRDVESVAIETAYYHKTKYPERLVEVVTRADGTRRIVLPDGRLA